MRDHIIRTPWSRYKTVLLEATFHCIEMFTGLHFKVIIWFQDAAWTKLGKVHWPEYLDSNQLDHCTRTQLQSASQFQAWACRWHYSHTLPKACKTVRDRCAGIPWNNCPSLQPFWNINISHIRMTFLSRLTERQHKKKVSKCDIRYVHFLFWSSHNYVRSTT